VTGIDQFLDEFGDSRLGRVFTQVPQEMTGQGCFALRAVGGVFPQMLDIRGFDGFDTAAHCRRFLLVFEFFAKLR
jgi:hypothetical protein